jgi:hypothetical protein
MFGSIFKIGGVVGELVPKAIDGSTSVYNICNDGFKFPIFGLIQF